MPSRLCLDLRHVSSVIRWTPWSESEGGSESDEEVMYWASSISIDAVPAIGNGAGSGGETTNANRRSRALYATKLML